MKKTIASTMMAGAMAATLVLFGCGSQPAKTETTQETTTQQQKTETKTEQQTTTEQKQAPAETKQQTTTNTNTTTETTPAPQQNAAQITADEAMQIALDDAGLSEADVMGLSVELDLDDAVVHYDVDFKSGGYEYDYDIDSTTGAIIYSNAEIDD